MRKIKSNKLKNIKFKKNIVIKKFSNSEKLNSLNEIKGYNYFLNKDIFQLIPRIKIVKKYNSVLIYYKRFNQTHVRSFFKINKFYNISKIKFKKINSSDYLIDLINKLNEIKNFDNKFPINKILISIKKYKNQTLLISPNHCDFIHYNTLICNNKYYTIDFEYFKKKIIFNYDLYNWYFTPLFTNIKRYKLNFFSNFLIDIFFYILKKKNFGYQQKINKAFYNDKYLFFFLVEKYLFLFNEKKKNSKEFFHINVLEKLILKKLVSYK